MAGDWIKMRADLHTHPKVVRIASALKADRLRVVGGLHAVWCLFDAHSEDGSLSGYSAAAVDELIGFEGFAGAMCGVKWLTEQADGLILPEFDEHNGQSAKRRATETKRKRQEREQETEQDDRKVSASNADKKRSREEKRREEKIKKKEGEGTASPRGSRLPTDWKLSDEDRAYCAATRPELSPDAVAQDFRDYWTAKAGKDGVKLDWRATWQMWVRKQHTPRLSQLPAGSVVTVPSRPGRDPELVKRDQDMKNRAAMPAAVREQAQKIKQGALV